MKELQPLNENVLLELNSNKQEKTSGGIIIPDTAQEKPQHAKVAAIGNIENAEIKVGDTVFYKKFSGSDLKMDDKEYLVIPYADLLAKVVETDEI